MSITKEEIVRLNYECILISILVENENIKSNIRDNGLRMEDLPCFADRINKINDYYNSSQNPKQAERDLTQEMNNFIYSKAKSGEMKKDLANMLPKIYSSLDEALSSRENC